jgi:hypothetical protein
MLRVLTFALVATGFVLSSAEAEPSPYYNIQDYISGAGSNGAHTGSHQISGSGGTIGAVIVGGADPSVEVSGSTVDGVAAYLYGRADYDYHITMSAATADIGDALARSAQSSGGSEIVGYLSGYLRVAPSPNGQVTASLSAGSGAGGNTIYAGCVGYYCGSPAPGFAAYNLVPITLDVQLNDFDFGCATNPNTGKLEGDCTTAVTTVGLQVSASLRTFSDLSAGSVDAYLDPIFSLSPDFLERNGLGGTDLIFSQDSVSTVPEPASWGLMLAGFALLGGVLRRSRHVGQRGLA